MHGGSGSSQGMGVGSCLLKRLFRCLGFGGLESSKQALLRGILGGSGDLVSRVISKVTIVISTYNAQIYKVLITLLTKSNDPLSKVWVKCRVEAWRLA